MWGVYGHPQLLRGQPQSIFLDDLHAHFVVAKDLDLAGFLPHHPLMNDLYHLWLCLHEGLPQEYQVEKPGFKPLKGDWWAAQGL
jgi:hypothetical protein